SDLYALSAILYQLATGELPFGAPSRIKLVKQRVWRTPVPPRALAPAISPALQEIILRGLEPLPGQRYQSADEMAFDLRHLDIVALTERSERSERASVKAMFRGWLKSGQTMREIERTATREPQHPPIILIAVDLRNGPGLDDVRSALREAAVSALANMRGARLACLNVFQTSLMGIDENVDETGENVHIRRIAELRKWAEPMGLPREKVTYHLIEGRSIAHGILDFAKSNHVAHMVIGAPTGDRAQSKRIAAAVMQEAPCTVTMVRPQTATADVSSA
ncbi:MAG: universal stress protein, partial [Proteobacteria bacterium]|nr:universal stress protein [Pseudomonadota bacterium]